MPDLMKKTGVKLGIPLVISGLLLLAFPWLGRAYYTHILILVFLNIILAMSYRLLYVTGLVSFCHVTFYAIGAYTSTILAVKLALPFGICLLAGGIVAAISGALLILATSRVRGSYFFLISFGFLGVMDTVFKQWKSVTGGTSGITDIPPIIPGFDTVTNNYHIILAFTALAIFIVYLLDRSRFGSELVAIGEAEDLTEVIGINVLGYRVLACAIGALFAGFAGSLFAHYESFIAPASFPMWTTIYILSWCVIGGVRKFWGPIVGAVLMTFIGEFSRMSGSMQAILYAAALLAAVMAMPDGIVGLFDNLRTRFGRRRTRVEAPN
jgi:branched-chain amino acid transport system permease protein